MQNWGRRQRFGGFGSSSSSTRRIVSEVAASHKHAEERLCRASSRPTLISQPHPPRRIGRPPTLRATDESERIDITQWIVAHVGITVPGLNHLRVGRNATPGQPQQSPGCLGPLQERSTSPIEMAQRPTPPGGPESYPLPFSSSSFPKTEKAVPNKKLPTIS